MCSTEHDFSEGSAASDAAAGSKSNRVNPALIRLLDTLLLSWLQRGVSINRKSNLVL